METTIRHLKALCIDTGKEEIITEEITMATKKHITSDGKAEETLHRYQSARLLQLLNGDSLITRGELILNPKGNLRYRILGDAK